MSLAEVKAGQRRVHELLGELDKGARGVFIGPSPEEIYMFDIRLGSKSVRLEFPAERLEDLAHNGQVKASIVAQLKGALDSLRRAS